jgi:hypothetical protein
MNLEAWSERSSRMKNWMIVGTGSRRFGMGGMPSDSADRERKTNDWSIVSFDGRIRRTGKRPEWVVIPRRFEQDRPGSVGRYWEY